MAKNVIYYYDISKIGKDFTGKKDLSISTNEQALLESVINIITTEPGERVMNPTFGCALDRYLFEPLDNVTSNIISKTIRDSLNKFEPRIESLDVKVQAMPDINSYNITVIFTMKTSNKEQTINITMNRIR